MRVRAHMRPQSASEQPGDALVAIAGGLRAERTVISEHVIEPTATPVLASFVARGPRCEAAPREYAQVIESIREGYLLHYGTPRVLAGLDRDLALLAGDHLYAHGLDRLADLGDLDAVRELADLISLCSQLASSPSHGNTDAEALWLASATAVAAGGSAEHESAKNALREGEAGAGAALRAAASRRAGEAGLEAAFDEVAEAIESGADGFA